MRLSAAKLAVWKTQTSDFFFFLPPHSFFLSTHPHLWTSLCELELTLLSLWQSTASAIHLMSLLFTFHLPVLSACASILSISSRFQSCFIFLSIHVQHIWCFTPSSVCFSLAGSPSPLLCLVSLHLFLGICLISFHPRCFCLCACRSRCLLTRLLRFRLSERTLLYEIRFNYSKKKKKNIYSWKIIVCLTSGTKVTLW